MDIIKHFNLNKKIAIIAFGYADGYPRTLSNISYVFFKKKTSNNRLNFYMDYMIVDISRLKSERN